MLWEGFFGVDPKTFSIKTTNSKQPRVDRLGVSFLGEVSGQVSFEDFPEKSLVWICRFGSYVWITSWKSCTTSFAFDNTPKIDTHPGSAGVFSIKNKQTSIDIVFSRYLDIHHDTRFGWPRYLQKNAVPSVFSACWLGQIPRLANQEIPWESNLRYTNSGRLRWNLKNDGWKTILSIWKD